MATPQLTPEQIQHLSKATAEYIANQRDLFAPSAVPPSQEQRAAMEGFFPTEVLDNVRLLVMPRGRVQNPAFYPDLRQLGFRNLPDFSMMAAITFQKVVVSHEPFTNGLFFHELVHVEQYRQLGVPRFAELYLRGFLKGGGYDGIPLEVNAYELEAKYEQAPNVRFSVEDEVNRWIAERQF